MNASINVAHIILFKSYTEMSLETYYKLGSIVGVGTFGKVRGKFLCPT